jgi:hypothetical protein
VFDDSLKHDGKVYRTASLHPVFQHNSMILKEKGLLIFEQSFDILEKTPNSAPCRSSIQKFMELAELLAA